VSFELDAFSIVVIALSVLAVLSLFWVIASGQGERKDEDDAREFFDRHGHWPDEEPR
jgi:nitrogen fixation-related uncharacterized protein